MSTSKANPFVTKVLDAVNLLNIEYCKVDVITERLRKAMGLSEKQLKMAEEQKISWDVGDFCIYAMHRFGNGWREALEIIPQNIACQVGSGGVGWSNVSHRQFPEGWVYKPSGTKTVLIPPAEVVDQVERIILGYDPS